MSRFCNLDCMRQGFNFTKFITLIDLVHLKSSYAYIVYV